MMRFMKPSYSASRIERRLRAPALSDGLRPGELNVRREAQREITQDWSESYRNRFRFKAAK